MTLSTRALAVVCLVATLPTVAPAFVETNLAAVILPRAPAEGRFVPSATKLNFASLRRDPIWVAVTSTSPERPGLGQFHLQSTGGGWSGLSTAKKTWIIVGIVVGAAVVVAAVSHHGSHNNGGGGGY